MNGSDLHLTSEISHQLRHALQTFCTDAGSLSSAILDLCGTQIASGSPPHLLNYPGSKIGDTPEVAALAAGAFAATRELANRLGDSSFHGLMHHGRERHFYICPITDDYLLLTLFATGTPAGVVRHCASKTVDRLAELLTSATTPPAGWQGRMLAGTAPTQGAV